jgi:hypothetical protein
MDRLLEHARALYLDRRRIALAAMVVIFSVTFYLFYSPGIYSIPSEPPVLPPGWVQGFRIVYSFNTVGFFLAISIIVFVYTFWCWAFLPIPAANYTLAVLRGVFGPSPRISQRIGGRFKVSITQKMWMELACRVKEQGSGMWFVYKMTSSPISTPHVGDIAVRHGMSASNGRFNAWVNSGELHQRTILMVRAMLLASQRDQN